MKKENVLEEIVKERIKENEKLFSERELKIINNNVNIIKKIYILGLKNAKEIYTKAL